MLVKWSCSRLVDTCKTSDGLSASLAVDCDWFGQGEGAIFRVSAGFSQIWAAQRPDNVASFYSLSGGIVKIECLYLINSGNYRFVGCALCMQSDI